MSFYDDASLVFLAGGAAGKDGKAYSLKPTDGSGDFTFTRGTNLTATRVGKDGYIEKGNEQLARNTTWADVGLNTAPTGWTDYRLNGGTYDATSVSGQIQFVTTSTQRAFLISQNFNTISNYVLSVTVDEVNTAFKVSEFLGVSANADEVTYFKDGAVISYTTNIEAGSRYSLFVHKDNTSTTTFRIGIGANTNTEGDITVSKPQITYGLAPVDYVENTSTSSSKSFGLLEDEPRFDYSGGGCPALLMEPQRVNLVPHSEYHSDSTYGNNQVTTTDNEAVSPEGVQNAAKIVLDSGTNASNGGHYLTFSSTAGTTYTISVFAKAGEMRYFTFTYGSTSAGGGHFDLQEGTLLGTITNASYSDVTADIEDYGNGWYRLVVSLTDSLSVAGRFLSMKPSPSASVPSYNNYSSTGDGTSGAYIYGFQLEEGSYATSYIPTYGSAATREEDSISLTDLLGNGIVNTLTQGTLLLDLEVSGQRDGTASYRHFRMVDNTDSSTNRIRLWEGGSGSSSLLRVDFTSGYIEESIDADTQNKVVVRWDSSGTTIYKNGANTDSTTSQLIFASTPKFLTSIVSNYRFNSILVFPTVLSNNDCEILTGTSYASFASMASTLSYTQYE